MVEQKRESFRVEYPSSLCPKILLKNKTYNVFDVSEFGIKFHYSDVCDFKLGESVSAKIIFSDDEPYDLDTTVVRIDKYYVSVKLLTPLPLSKIRSEHLYLIQFYSEKK